MPRKPRKPTISTMKYVRTMPKPKRIKGTFRR